MFRIETAYPRQENTSKRDLILCNQDKVCIGLSELVNNGNIRCKFNHRVSREYPTIVGEIGKVRLSIPWPRERKFNEVIIVLKIAIPGQEDYLITRKIDPWNNFDLQSPLFTLANTMKKVAEKS